MVAAFVEVSDTKSYFQNCMYFWSYTKESECEFEFTCISSSPEMFEVLIPKKLFLHSVHKGY